MSLASVLSALALRDRLQCRRPAVPLGRHRPARRGARRARGGRLRQWRHHRQAEGASIHRYARHLVHRARRRLSHEREHDGDRPAGRHSRLRQRRADLLHSRARRRPLFPSTAGSRRRASAPHGHHPALSGRCDRVRRRAGRCSCCTRPSSAATPTRSAAAWTRRCAAASPSIATSSSSTCCRPRPPASRAFCRRCASPRARR